MRLLVPPALAACLLCACGARTGLADLDADGATPSRDAGRVDSGRDAGPARDAGPEPLACDGRPLPRVASASSIEVPPRMNGLAAPIPDPEGILLVGGQLDADTFATEMAFVDLASRTFQPVAVTGDEADLPLGDGVVVHVTPTDRLIVVGGRTQAGLTDRTLRLTGMGDPTGMRFVSVQRLPPYPPGPAGGLVATRDPTLNRVIVFGGRGPDGEQHDETWALELEGRPRWRRVASDAGPPPGPRAMGYDPTAHRAILITGDDDLAVWALSLEEGAERWQRLAPIDFSPSTRGELFWDDAACGFHLLSARRTRCVLEHYVLAVEDDSATTVFRGVLELDPAHFIAQSFFVAPDRLYVLASQDCELSGMRPVPNLVAHELRLVR